MPTLFLSYLDLSPGLRNHFDDLTHDALLSILRNNFVDWSDHFDKFKDYDLGFIIVTKKHTSSLEIKGPSISHKKKIFDYTIFLPDEINSLDHYIDLVFEGIFSALSKFKISEKEILRVKEEVKKVLS